MAKSNVFMSWTNVTITYGTTPTVITLGEVVEMDVNISDKLEPWQADGSKFARLMAVGTSERGGTISGGDIAKLVALPRGEPCTIEATLLDALNQTVEGSGSLTCTWTNAIFHDQGAKGQTNKFAGGSASFTCFAPDGATDPLTVSQAT